MYGVFHSLRKRTAKRRLVALWFCLIAIELFCPIFCDEPGAVAANLRSSETEISSEFRTSSDPESSSIEQSPALSDDESAYCNDECLCHAAPIPCLVVGPKTSAIRSEPMMIGYTHVFSSSLPPPYLPPKFS